jgi:hypothetical protein
MKNLNLFTEDGRQMLLCDLEKSHGDFVIFVPTRMLERYCFDQLHELLLAKKLEPFRWNVGNATILLPNGFRIRVTCIEPTSERLRGMNFYQTYWWTDGRD